jgi:hypothetical protein
MAAIAVAVTLSAFVSISASTTTEHSSAASHPRVDILDNGNVVVSLDLAGDLPGTITLTFTRDAAGAMTGEWAAKVAYADNTDPETGEEPAHHDHDDGEEHPHKDFLRLIDRGALGGVIQSGELTFDGSGALTSMNAVLAVEQGTEEFTGAAGGTGTATLSQVTIVF